MSNLIRLIKSELGYTWVKGKDKVDKDTSVAAKAFGIWWLRIKRDQVEAGMKMLETKSNVAFFSERGDYLYADTITSKT